MSRAVLPDDAMQPPDIWGCCRGKIVEGRVAKIFKERALLEQAFIKDTSKTVAEHIKAQVATIGENIQVPLLEHPIFGVPGERLRSCLFFCSSPVLGMLCKWLLRAISLLSLESGAGLTGPEAFLKAELC